MIRDPRIALIAALLIFLALLPVYVMAGGNNFLLSLFTRIIILALAATSLNLILGYGGMVSFGHAVYIGIGGYVVGILAKEGIPSGFVQWPLALVVSALFALVIGALSLRTRGVYFIMITLAFAQMLYYVAVSLDRYGADDGLTIYRRSQFGLLNLSNKIVFYYLCFALLLVVIFLVARLVNSRFGMVIRGATSNERRMRAIGFPIFRYRLVCFVIAGVLCGLAGHPARQSHRFRQPGDDALDAVGRPHRDGGARRHGLDLRSADRGGRAAGAGRGAVGRHGILANHPRSSAAADRAVRTRRHRRPAAAAP